MSYQNSAWDPDKTVVSHRRGMDAAIITYGRIVNNAVAAADMLAEQGINVTVVRLTCLSPIDYTLLANTLCGIRDVIVVEETSAGIHDSVAFHIGDDHSVHCIDLGCEYVTHGHVTQLYEKYGLDAVSIANKIKEVLGK